MTESSTLLLYSLIITVSFIFAALSQRKKRMIDGEIQVRTSKTLFLLSFLVAWFFYAFAGMSNDYAEYQHVFNIVTRDNFYRIWIEPGYALLNLLIKTVVNDSVVGIVVIKSITIGLVFQVIYDYRNQIPVGLAVLGYLCYCYLDSFCMIRINLASAIVLYAIACFEKKDAKIQSLFFLVIAVSIHYSSIIMAFVVVGFWLCTRKSIGLINACLLMTGVLFGVRLVAIPVMNQIIHYVPILAKYGRKYSAISKTGSNLMQYVIHAPLIFVFHQSLQSILNHHAQSHRIISIGLIMAPFSLFFGTMGYSVQVIGRTFVYFLYIWIITVPYFYRLRCKQNVRDQKIVFALIVLWYLIKLGIYLRSGSLRSSGIERYFFIW